MRWVVPEFENKNAKDRNFPVFDCSWWILHFVLGWVLWSLIWLIIFQMTTEYPQGSLRWVSRAAHNCVCNLGTAHNPMDMYSRTMGAELGPNTTEQLTKLTLSWSIGREKSLLWPKETGTMNGQWFACGGTMSLVGRNGVLSGRSFNSSFFRANELATDRINQHLQLRK